MSLTAYNIVNFINQLPKDRTYNYVYPGTKNVILITDIILPDGPIKFKRYNPAKGEKPSEAEEETITSQMIWRIANAFIEDQPINFDRILGASYNTRSVLEALIVHTPQFYYCYPGRIQNINSSTTIKRGHKHVIWCPEEPHHLGDLVEKETDIVVSEVPNLDAYYDSIDIPDDILSGEIDIQIQRRHALIQVALIMIGKQLGYQTWVAQNDKGIVYHDKRIGDLDCVISSLKSHKMFTAFNKAIEVGNFIDCIWFYGEKNMPAVMEIEHTTGVTSGLTRMKKLQDELPSYPTRYVIVAPDDDKLEVINKANNEIFKSMDIRFFPYSAVEELYALCQKRKLHGITEEFLDCYMETILL